MFTYRLHSKISKCPYLKWPCKLSSLIKISQLNFRTCLNSSFAYCSYTRFSSLNNIYNFPCKYKRNFSSSSRLLISTDDKIPDYLKGIVSEVSELEEEDLEDKELENCMEDEIIDFLYSRGFPYDELEGNVIVKCPSCGYSNKTHEMFIDKNSGMKDLFFGIYLYLRVKKCKHLFTF